MDFRKFKYSLIFRFFIFSLSLLVQACANTTIGNQLASSFDESNTFRERDQNSVSQKVKSDSTKIVPINKSERSNKKKISQTDVKNLKGSNKEDNLQKTKERRKNPLPIKNISVKYNPQPYRLILKLSAANPSAPAEAVTEALRRAGIKFEVEKIERYDFKEE